MKRRLPLPERLLLVLVTALLAACAAAPQVPARVEVPVAVACLPDDLPVRPYASSDADLARMSDYGLVLALRRDTLVLGSYARQLEAVVSGCGRFPAKKTEP